MKISIVTLSFNQRRYLRDAIESVLQQGCPELEYIVVDPGSTDGSCDLIRLYSDRIAHTIFETDAGPADGLNKGFSVATGEILGFLNADDVLLPGALHRVASFFSSHPGMDMAMGNGYILDEHGRKKRWIEAADFTVRRYLYGGAHWLQQSTFFRRSIYLRSPGFNPLNRTCWDGELFVQMKLQGARIGYIDADLSGFRIHPGSNTGSGTNHSRYREDRRRIFEEIQGRKWRATDELRHWYYRGDGLLSRLHKSIGVRG